jgi:hypothetical protein
MQGSEQFEGSKEEWERRKYEAVQAFAEWVPVRGLDHAKVDLAGCQRTFKFGNLMSLVSAVPGCLAFMVCCTIPREPGMPLGCAWRVHFCR